MQRSISTIVQQLAQSQTTFLHVADAIPSQQWNRKPEPQKWSAAEVVAHLLTVESTVISGADRITQKPPKPIPFWKCVHLPIWLVESRIIRRKSPLPLDSSVVGTKEEMLGKLRAARERTLAFVAETEPRDLSAYRWPHPFVGMLNVYEWFQLLAAHQVRHAKQMKEIAEQLPKLVTNAENR